MLQPDDSSFVKPFDDGDIPLLTTASFEGSTRKEIRARVTRLQKQAGKGNIYLIKENQSLLLCGFSVPDTSSETAPVTSANQASIWIIPSTASKDSLRSLYRKAMSFLQYEAFSQRSLHKIRICIESKNSVMREILEENQFRQEGVLTDHYFIDSRYDDGLLYAMLAADFRRYSTGAVPFLSGYLVLQTTNDAVFAITIIKEGEDVPSSIDDGHSFKNQISENNKVIKPSGEKPFYLSERAYPYLEQAAVQLFQYTKGLLTKFDLAFEYDGATEFQKQVWAATMQIPYGQTRTYEEIALKIQPKDSTTDLRLLSRSVGTALGKNPIMIAIPCHRVIGKDGKLKGFSGGLEVKDFLLSHEMLFIK